MQGLKSLFGSGHKWKMEALIVAANIIKAALSNIFYINIESDSFLNQQPSLLCCS